MSVKIVSKPYAVTDQAISQARDLGISGDAAARLRRMAKRSAPVTHHSGNRRYEEFVLDVEGKTVRSIDRF